jgi:polyisoprenoid-binding protein YceI
MKTDRLGKLSLVLAFLAVMGANVAGANGLTEFQTQPGGRSLVTIEGTSTLHDWTVRGRVIEAKVSLPESLLTDRDPAALEGVKGEVAVSVEALRSFKDGRPYSTRMDEIMREKLKAEQHPTIIFVTRKVRPGAAPAGADFTTLEVEGVLTVAGEAKEVTIPVEVRATAGGPWRLTARIALKMSDFKIDPPVALAGTIRTGDAVTVTLECLVAPNKE